MVAVVLPDIERGPTWSDEHKHACLVRSLAARTQDDRLRFFEAYQRHHGRDSAIALYREVQAEQNGGRDDATNE